jgi:Uma2 family endonuclease
MELLELPLTRELFLDPQYGDKILQGNPHVLVVTSLYERLQRYFRPEADTLVLSDMKHYLGPGESYAPAPDISIVRGLPRPDPTITNFDVREQGVFPCLVIEVVSPAKAEIRETDEVDKAALYARVGIPEYFMVHLPRGSALRPLRLTGLRRGADGRYRAVPPDAQGRIVSEATGLSFAVSPAQDDIDIFVAATGERLLTPVEEEERRRAAEERAEQEAKARQEAVEELARLRAEIERLKTSGG